MEESPINDSGMYAQKDSAAESKRMYTVVLLPNDLLPSDKCDIVGYIRTIGCYVPDY